jgi:16S rRNA (adenine1518-N6/adenine1519-N6)-dimethyltransferase
VTAQTRSEIAALLERHGLAPIHRLGQHFLADANITRKIVWLAGVGDGSKVVEVGAGTGTLTRALAEAGAHVVAYEIDRGLAPVLEEVTNGMSVELRIVDVTDVRLSEDLVGTGWSMVSNLPYNVGTVVVLDALRSASNIELFVVMVQKEVARRFTAGVGNPDYGLPSVVAGIYASVELGFGVSPQVFYPAPSVESAVVVMKRVETPEHAERAVEIARAAFGQRRKMLRGSLSAVFADPVSSLIGAGIDPTSRAEDVSPEGYLRLAEE